MKKFLLSISLLPCVLNAMNVKTQKALFPDAELRAVISQEREISKNWFAWNVLQHPERDKWIPLYVAALENQERPSCQRIAKKLLAKFVKDYQKHAKELGLNDDIIQSIKRNAKVKKSYNKSSGKSAKKRLALRNEALEKIKKMHLPVSDFREIAKNRRFILKMKEALRLYNKHDPDFNAIRFLVNDKVDYSYDPERIVDIPGCQKTLLVPHPVSEKYLSLYYQAAMQHNVPVLITLCSPYEDKKEVLPFWEDRVVKAEGGKEIRCTKLDEKVIYQSPEVAEIKDTARARVAKAGGLVPEEFYPRVVERRLRIEYDGKAHEVVHLHYENWPDHQEAPDINALHILIDRRDSLLTSKDDIVILNCKATIGRSGTFFLTDWGRKLVSAMAEEGIPFSEMTLNFAEMLLEARKFRPILSGNPTQLRQAMDIIGLHFERLQEKAEL